MAIMTSSMARIHPGHFTTVLVLVATVVVATVRSQDGYASLNGGTTGGARGTTVNVATESELRSAVSADTPRTVRITRTIAVTSPIRVGSNKSILGSGPGAGITGAGFYLYQVRNVIIRNLHIAFPRAPNDGVSIDSSTNVWVDHNEFYSDKSHGKEYYDGLLDIKHGSDFVTVSWNKFHDHYKTLLIGNDDGEAGTDRGKLHVTIHHNWFKNCESRLPLLRFGTAHVYNNLYENIDSSGINSRMNAQVLVENNVFRNAKNALITNLYSGNDGYAVERGNDWGGTSRPVITKGGAMFRVPYSARVDPTGNVASAVRSGAGVQGGDGGDGGGGGTSYSGAFPASAFQSSKIQVKTAGNKGNGVGSGGKRKAANKRSNRRSSD